MYDAQRPFIAIVDDDLDVGRSLVRLLGLAGYDAQSFYTVEAFLLAAALRRPDCLIVDMDLGESSGVELARLLRSRGLLCPIIFISGDPTGTGESQALALGQDFLAKPVTESELLASIALALSQG
jgi:FixJ family two-component response regulator